MNDSKFGKALNLSIVKAGKKVINATRPEVILLPTLNRFSINSLGSELMQLETGNTVTLLVDNNAESFNEKFYITKGMGDDKATLAAVGKSKGFGRTLTFNYSGIYSQMIQGSVDAKELSADGLEELGLAEKRVTPQGKETYSALKKVHFELVSVGEQELGEDENGDPIEQEVWALTNSKMEDYTPRVSDVEESDEDKAEREAAEAEVE